MAFLATFVGVGKYADPSIRDLVGSTRDAVALHALFADSFPASNPTLLVDDAATAENIRKMLQATLGAATSDDVVIFSFSGHGSHDHRLAAFDTTLSALAASSVGMDELAGLFKATNARAVFCILDCCFSGAAPAKVLEDSPIPRDPGALLDALVGEGRILLAASGTDQVAYEFPHARHGVLTKALIDFLLAAEGPVDLMTSIGEVMRMVQAEAARMGVEQTPVLLGSIKGGLVIPKLQPGKTFFAAFPELQKIRVTSDIRDLGQFGFPQPIIDEWCSRYPSGFNELQLEAINQHGITSGNSLLVIAPTSAGKTFIGEIAAAKAIVEGRKAVFLLPYKALVNEKFEQFSLLYGTKLGMRVIRCSGDYNDQVSAFLRGKYDLALLTYEMFLQLIVGNPHTLGQLGLIVIDEAQFITDPSRGINVELLLTFVLAAREKAITPQIIALSAVIGDANNFNQWIGSEILNRTERPVPLIEGVMDRSGLFQFVDENGKQDCEQVLRPYDVQVRRERPSAQDLIVPLVRKLVGAGEKVIIFRNARGPAQGCANYLAESLGLPPASDALERLPAADQSTASIALRQCLRGGTAFHNSNLKPDEKSVVEQVFRDPKSPLRVLAATTTVAAGINTPASTVLLAESEFLGEDGRPFTVAEYKNMAGRAGRLGFNEKGKSMIYAETPTERVVLFNKYVQGRLEQLQSSFDPAHVQTWLVRLLAQVPKLLRANVATLLANTYSGFLSARQDPQWRSRMQRELDQLVIRMMALGLIEAEGEFVSLSLLGRACGRSSLSFESAMRLIEIVRNVPLHLINAVNLMGLMQGLPAEEMGYTPLMKGPKEYARVSQAQQRFASEVIQSLQRYAQDQMEFYGRCKRAAILHDWISGRKVEQIEADFSTGAFAGRIEYGDIRRFADLTRFHLQAASNILAVLLLDSNPQSDLDVLLTRLEFGIPAEAVDLVELPLALTRGECLNLLNRGIRKPAELWTAAPDLLMKLLGEVRGAQLERFRPKPKTDI